MAEIGSARRLMEDYQRHIVQLAELRVLLEERLGAADAGLDDIAEIEAAIERMDLGLYGTCRRCEAFIPVAQLRLAPHKQECAACRERMRMSA
ncbi:hypothetical protein [Sphaerimonospora thailandensis]|uniref:DksA C4-type domain-containing protein n=1 Tax=Sphaerimonospora thailandensis TaxID=795644 RepID=A0A8J3W0N2_9ACTN|nr:hypothetical protein [Sphaerimonospora thailandensis]GIH71360.1 hypothetical protein Mth01_36130 [Sphaerimonospora thailandensis]